jgi:hypothetical protein
LIDHFASRRCGATVGDLRARFGEDFSETRVVDVLPVEGVGVRAEADLLPLLADGAELRLAGPSFAPHLAVSLRHPEAWLDYLETHPQSRR